VRLFTLSHQRVELFDLARGKILDFSVRKIAARLTPCKIGKPEGQRFNKGRAY